MDGEPIARGRCCEPFTNNMLVIMDVSLDLVVNTAMKLKFGQVSLFFQKVERSYILCIKGCL
jgi:hypothetical protein